MGYPFGPLYRLLLLTGVRLSEACEASWQEFDFNERVWTIPAARMKKTGSEAKPHMVPLTDAILQVLETLPRFPERQVLVFHQYGLAPLKANRFRTGTRPSSTELMEQNLGIESPPSCPIGSTTTSAEPFAQNYQP